jgi:hypothetical protein
MSVIFIQASGYNPEDLCMICHEDLGTTGVVAHSTTQSKEFFHTFHEKCLRTWLDINQTCPFCRTPVNTLSLLTWKEKSITIIKNLASTAFDISLITGALYGITTLPFTIIGGELVSVYAGHSFEEGRIAGLLLSSVITICIRRALS